MGKKLTRATRGVLQPERLAPSNVPLDKLLTPDEVAAMLGVSLDTLPGWRHRRVGPPFVKIGVLVRYRRAEVQGWIAAGAVSTDAAQL